MGISLGIIEGMSRVKFFSYKRYENVVAAATVVMMVVRMGIIVLTVLIKPS